MKILIAYDGSDSSKGAIDDLARAGLPERGEMLVLSVAEIWPELQEGPYHEPGLEMGFGPLVIDAKAQKLAEHREVARAGAARARERFAKWNVESDATLSSAVRGIIERADAWRPDMIVVGAEGLSKLERVFLGSISHGVLTHAHCSVRVSRLSAGKAPAVPRILIAVDGSIESAHAVRLICQRAWPAGTHVKVVSAIDSAMRTAVPVTHAFAAEWMQIATTEDPRVWTRAVGRATAQLKEAGLSATSLIREGDPKKVILEEAKEWNATSIFVGARGLGRVARILLGSVSLAVATRATCSVEVIRKND